MTTIFLNVETVPADAFIGQAIPPSWAYDATVKPLPEMGSVPSNYKNQEKIAAYEHDLVRKHQEAIEKHSRDWAARAAKLWESCSVNPLKARIVVGVVAVGDSDPIVLPEEHIVDWLTEPNAWPATFVAYNCGFDRQMIFARALATNHTVVSDRFRYATWKDPGEVFRSLGSRWYGADTFKLNDMCAAFGVPHNPAFTGADVLPAYLRGDLSAIHAHCLDRVTALRELYWKVCP